MLGRLRVLAHLVDREHRREHARERRVREDARDRGLTDRAPGLRCPQEGERLGLLEVVEHVVAVAVGAVVAGREDGVERDLAGERVGGVRYTRDERHITVAHALGGPRT